MTSVNTTTHNTALKIAAIYAFISFLWIAFSDQILLSFVNNAILLTRIQMFKGWAFVIITAFIIYFLLYKELSLVKQTETDLRESEEKFRTLADTSPLVMVMTSGIEQVIEYINPSAVELFGYTQDEIPTIKEWWPLAYPDEEYRNRVANEWQQKVAHAIETKSGIEPVEAIVTCKGGLKKTILWHFSAVGKQNWVLGLDLTERKRAEEKHAKSLQLLNEMGEVGKVGGWEFNVDTREAWWTEEVYHIYEVSLDYVPDVEKNINFYSDASKPVIAAAVQRSIEYGEPYDLELELITAKGNLRHVHAIGMADLEHRRIYGFFQDITEQKKAESERIQSKEQLQFVVEGSQLGFWDWNMVTGEVVRNERWAEMLGYTLREIAFTICQWTDLIHPDDRDRVWKSINEHIEGHTSLHEAEYRMLAKNGQYVWILDRARIVKHDAGGRPLRICGTHLDITDRKKAEEEKQAFEQQMQHTQKLESLGVLSGGIAHDFNNILAAIIGYCGLTKMNYETAEKNIPQIENAAERAAGLCRQMMTYAGKAQFTKTKVNMVTKVDEILGMLKSTLPQNAVFKSNLSAEIPIIEGDAGQLRQVVMNLIINASEAIGTEQGEVNVSLASIKVGSGKSYEDYHGKAIPPGEYVCLEVTDDGCGMDEATKWRIFEPFYTTKFTGRGLGMSAVLGIIKSHAGALQLFSQPGHGTTFKVYFPILTNEIDGDEVQTVSVPASPWFGSGTILLAEDEAQVRYIAKEMLQMFGFTVLEAGNGKEALDIYLKNTAEITLVVTDMGMPVLDGYQLFSELKKLKPELPIIVSSGFGDTEVSARMGSGNIAGIINKPYSMNQLQEVLKSVVGGTASNKA